MSEVTHPATWVGSIVIRAKDVQSQADFWADVLGYTRRIDRHDFILLVPRKGDGPGVSIDAARSEVQIPPRIHLDLYSTAQEAEVDRLIGLGATLVSWDNRPDDADYVILADPEGNRFCVIDVAE